MAKNKGAEGQGDTKTIAWREEQKKKSRPVKKSSSRTDRDTEGLIILTMDDFLKGYAVTGHHVAIGDAVFEVRKETLALTRAACKQLAPYVDRMQYVFVTEGQLTNNAFESPLSHTAREKQMTMWNYIRTAIGEEGRMAILKRREMSRVAPPEKPATPIVKEAETLPSKEEPSYVGENAKRWNEASAEIATAFESMSAEKPAEIRIGTNQHEGTTLGFFYSNGGNIRIYAGHVGTKSPLAGKVLDGIYLEARRGELSETIPETLNGLAFGKSVFAMHGFVMDLPRNLRDPILSGMIHVVRRNQKPAHLSHPPALHVVKTASAEPPQKATVPAPAISAKNGLQEMVDALLKSGAAPELIAQATLAYQASQTNAVSGSKAA